MAPRLSPDGLRLALSRNTGNVSDIHTYDLQRNNLARLSFGSSGYPVWSPDGRYIAFRIPQKGLAIARSDGSAKPQLLHATENVAVPFSFTPDGKRLAFMEIFPNNADIFTLSLEGGGSELRVGKPEAFARSSSNERQPVFSPDGRWLAYASDESGTYEVYVRAFPDNGVKWLVSRGGGVYPVWSRGDQELFFNTLGTGTILAAKYRINGNSFEVDGPRVWIEKRIRDSDLGGWNFDVAPDGKRIVAVVPVKRPEDPKPRNRVIFVMNFFDELRRRVPASDK